MKAPNNSWLEWIKTHYANSANDQLVKYAATHKDNWCNPAIFDAILNEFHHGITPEIRRMESPLF